ncbi:MAG: hypothetical protein AB7O52_19760 [Planctomycetota bacterium]
MLLVTSANALVFSDLWHLGVRAHKNRVVPQTFMNPSRIHPARK